MASKDTTWETYFGKPLIPYERADNQLSHETYNLPKSYEGKNKHLEDVLDFMIRKEDEFYTSKLLPWSFTEDLHVQWEIFRFNRTLMDVEPEQGIPRLVTAETERRSDNLLRRGLAFIIEHGFMTTDRGRRHFMMNLQQITDAVHTTAYFGVMHSLLSAKQHYKGWRRETDRTAKRPRNLLHHERSTWACVQKTHKGLYVLDAELKHQMKKNNVVPNVWVFPPKMSIYLDMAPREQTEYQLKGPQAAGNLEDDRTQKGIRWRDTEVFEAATFDIDFVNDDHDLLQRERQCGEFFVMPCDCESIKIFSADHDEFRIISRADAMAHALNFDSQRDGESRDNLRRPGGPCGDVDNLITFGVGEDYFKKNIGSKIEKALFEIDPLADGKNWRKETKDFHDWIDMFRGDPPKDVNDARKTKGEVITNPSLKKIWGCSASEFAKKLDNYLENIVKAEKPKNKKRKEPNADLAADFLVMYNDLYKAWLYDEAIIIGRLLADTSKPDILIFRPFQTYHMSSAILAAGGSELGETFHGHHDFQLSDDIIRKVHVGHYTHYSKSVVKQPKRYAIAEDVFAQGYISGEGVDFFSEETLREAVESGTIGTSDCRESLISWIIPQGGAGSDATVLDMTGEFSDRYREYGSVEFSGSPQLKRILQDIGLNREDLDDDIFLSNQYSDNTLCFRGKQFDKKGDDYVCTSLGNGHWKGLIYSGCMSVREGTIMTADHITHKIGEKL